MATDPISNHFLFDNATPLPELGGLTEYQYPLTHWVYTDQSRFWMGSADLTYISSAVDPGMRHRQPGLSEGPNISLSLGFATKTGAATSLDGVRIAPVHATDPNFLNQIETKVW